MQVSPAFARDIDGFGLTTAKIVYRLPDHHKLLQEFVWQDYDLFPRFPGLVKFLDFWETKLDGPLHSVTVAHACLLQPIDWQQINAGRLN